MKDKKEPELFVDPYYHKDTYMLSYASIINPIPDDTQWVHVDLEAVSAPPLIRPPGRPKKAKRRAPDEPKNAHLAKRTHQSLRCSNYQQFGHNSRTCKGPLAAKWKRQTPNFGRGETIRGETSKGKGRGRGRGRGKGRGRGSTPITQSQTSAITIDTSRPIVGMTSVLV